MVFLTSETSQYYKVCEGTACAQLAEYNKVRLQRKCRDVRVGGFCGLGHALPLFQSLAMHDKYTNTNTNANAKICKYTNANAHPLFAKPCNTQQSLLTLQDKASCNSYNGKMRAAGRVKKSASSCNRPILLLSHADHHHHHHGHCLHHHRLHRHRQQHQHQRRHYQC